MDSSAHAYHYKYWHCEFQYRSTEQVMSNVIACFIKFDAIMYTGMTNMHTGIANMNLEQTMYIGRARTNIARAKINTVHDIIHIGIAYTVVLA